MKKLLFIALFMSAASLGWSQSAVSAAKNWEIQLQGGLSFPVSPSFANGYPGESANKFHTGFNFGAAVGYKITPQLSILGEFQQQDFRSNNIPYVSPYNNYHYFWAATEVSLLLKYRILTGSFTPFVFAGPGLAVNMVGYQYTGASNPYYDDTYNTNEVDALLKAGLGVEYEVTDDLSVFAQADYTVNFNSGYLLDYTEGADMPTRYAPVQAGVILNL